MIKLKIQFEQITIFLKLIRWFIIVIPVSAVTGSVVALFLWLLDFATGLRQDNPGLLYLLPLAGVFIYFIYKIAGKNAEAGNNLIMDEIHKPGGGVPTRMLPLVLISTVITHLFGGSAGREGTAVQIGGSLAQKFGGWFNLSDEDIKIILKAGIAAGFGAVFGTPVTGAVFALEVLTVGRIDHKGLWPCLFAAVLADITCTSWGIGHTHYAIDLHNMLNTTFSFISFDLTLLMKVILAGVCFGLVSAIFSELSHSIKELSNQFIRIKWMIPLVGGVIIIGMTYLLGTGDYLGLGVTAKNPDTITILSSFKLGGADSFSWFWKLVFTAVTLGMGFKGGEVTPLFFIGATLGNALAVLTGVPVDLMAGLGFIAVFAGATNTPIACTIMGIELFGSEYTIYYAIACFTAYYFSGHTGIYNAQRLTSGKAGIILHQQNMTIKEIHEKRIGQIKRWFRKEK